MVSLCIRLCRINLLLTVITVPASSAKMLEKSRGLSVDCVTYDLEDSVAPNRKANARHELRQFLSSTRPNGAKEVAVRINSVDTKHALADLTEVVRGIPVVELRISVTKTVSQLKAPNVDAIVVPKVQSASDLHFVTDAIRHLCPDRHSADGASTADSTRPPLRILALIESAKGLTDIREICRASPYLSGLVFAAEDFCKDLSITRTPALTELLFARSSIVTAARAHNLPSAIDLVCTTFRGEVGQQRLEEECEDGKRLGFNGKQLIHPTQVAAAERCFAPAESEVEWAVRILTANAKAEANGLGAWTMDGKMIDAPVVGMAKDIAAKAEACDIDVKSIAQRWEGQAPE
jgi:citrate lyase subunit beta-like protein